MNKIEKLIKLFKSCDKVTFTVTGCGEETFKTIEFKNAISALEKQEIYEEELEMIYKMADDMALTGNVPSSKEHAEAIQNYLDWVKAGQMVAEVENE